MPVESCRSEVDIEASRVFLDRFNREGRRRCVPMTGSMALTHRCNLRCKHCYAGPDTNPPTDGSEPTTSQWQEWINQAIEAGCLFLLLTGGEPMLRPDFAEIYTHAKLAGLMVTVFTNGSRLTSSILDCFGDLPPYAVEISLYGATPGKHDAITGIPGSFVRSIRGVEQLLDWGVRVRLKSMLMKDNLNEFSAIRELAEETYGVEFRMDAALMPRLDGNRDPLNLRVSPEDAVAVELASASSRDKWARAQGVGEKPHSSDRLYSCGAGVIGFHVNAEGDLMPCLVPSGIQESLLSQTFGDAWASVVHAMAGQRAETAFECLSCPHKVMCGWCPAYARAENGRADSKPLYLCEQGRHRRARLGMM